jgi:hypothetical protein
VKERDISKKRKKNREIQSFYEKQKLMTSFNCESKRKMNLPWVPPLFLNVATWRI